MPFATMAARIAASRLGVAVSYTTAGGQVVACRGVPERPMQDGGAGFGAGQVMASMHVTIPQADLPETPAAGRAITVDGVAFTVAAPPEADARRATWRLALRRA